MKTIGMLGGLSWPSTIDYYRIINTLVAEKLGPSHSAKIILKSLDYHEFKARAEPKALLVDELMKLACLGVDSIIVCNNTLHKYLDNLSELALIPALFHAVDLTVQHALKKGYKNILFLATKYTMEDGFFTRALMAQQISSVVPDLEERNEIQRLQEQIRQGQVGDEQREYFHNLLARYKNLDAVVLGCTELPLVISPKNSPLTIINPTQLQCEAAVAHALS